MIIGATSLNRRVHERRAAGYVTLLAIAAITLFVKIVAFTTMFKQRYIDAYHECRQGRRIVRLSHCGYQQRRYINTSRDDTPLLFCRLAALCSPA